MTSGPCLLKIFPCRLLPPSPRIFKHLFGLPNIIKMCKEITLCLPADWIPLVRKPLERNRPFSTVMLISCQKDVTTRRRPCRSVRVSFQLMSGISTPILKLFGRFVDQVINICPSCPRSAVASSDASEGNTYSLVLTGDRTVSRSCCTPLTKT